MTRSFYFILVLSLALSTTGFRCYKDDVGPGYQFAAMFSLAPYKKVYSINDTIRLQFRTTDKTFIDQVSNTPIGTDSTHMLLQFQYVNLAVGPANQDTLCYSMLSGFLNGGLKVFSNYTVVELDTDCANTPFYSVEVSFIPKKRGVYGLRLPYPAVFFTCRGRATTFPAANLLFTYNLPDCNKDVFLSIPQGQRRDGPYTEELIDKKQIFAFEVQ